MARIAIIAGLVGILMCSTALDNHASASDPASSTDPHVLFSGSFRSVADAREEGARRVAIDKAIDTLFFAIRPIARSRLSKGTQIEPMVTIAFDAGKIRMKVPSAPEVISPENGTPIDVAWDGERSKLSQRIAGTVLVQTFQAEEGRKEHQWSITADGKTLTLKVIVSSPKLSNPVVYSLTYKRV
jgi:hypothetical protein